MPSNPPDEIWVHFPEDSSYQHHECENCTRYIVATPARENAEKLLEAATKLLASHRSSDVEDGLERVDADLVDALEDAIKICEEQSHGHD